MTLFVFDSLILLLLFRRGRNIPPPTEQNLARLLAYPLTDYSGKKSYQIDIEVQCLGKYSKDFLNVNAQLTRIIINTIEKYLFIYLL